jgi:hypothetical protein
MALVPMAHFARNGSGTQRLNLILHKEQQLLRREINCPENQKD